MSLQSEIANGYIDTSNGLVLPGRNLATNNGVMYTGEYLWLLLKQGVFDTEHTFSMNWSLAECMPTPGLLQRSPDNAGGQEGPDDYLGMCLASKVVYSPRGGIICGSHAGKLLKYGLTHFGVFRNEVGGSLFKAFLWRQPQLIAATLSGLAPGIGTKVLKLLGFPFYVCAAVSIALSCRENNGNADDRRLSWILIQLVQDDSHLCRWAAQGWYRRLLAHYGRLGMREVAHGYYEAGHPFVRYHQLADQSYYVLPGDNQ